MKKIIDLAYGLNRGIEMALVNLWNDTYDSMGNEIDHKRMTYHINNHDEINIKYHKNVGCDLECDPVLDACVSLIATVKFDDYNKVNIIYKSPNFELYNAGGSTINYTNALIRDIVMFVGPAYITIKDIRKACESYENDFIGETIL